MVSSEKLWKLNTLNWKQSHKPRLNNDRSLNQKLLFHYAKAFLSSSKAKADRFINSFLWDQIITASLICAVLKRDSLLPMLFVALLALVGFDTQMLLEMVMKNNLTNSLATIIKKEHLNLRHLDTKVNIFYRFSGHYYEQNVISFSWNVICFASC